MQFIPFTTLASPSYRAQRVQRLHSIFNALYQLVLLLRLLLYLVSVSSCSRSEDAGVGMTTRHRSHQCLPTSSPGSPNPMSVVGGPCRAARMAPACANSSCRAAGSCKGYIATS